MSDSKGDPATTKRPILPIPAVHSTMIDDVVCEQISRDMERTLYGIRQAPVPDLTWDPESKP